MKKVLRIKSSVFLIAVLGTLGSGCATIVKGTKQRVQINSEPAGATAKVGGQTVTTPASMILKSEDLCTIVVSKEGYQTQKVPLARGASGWVWGNLIFFPIGTLIGCCVDVGSGAQWVLKPAEVNVTLNALPPGVTASPLPDAGFKVVPDITQSLTDTGKVRICVICPRGLLHRISDGEEVIGITRPNTYTCWERKPGQLTLSMTDGERNSSMELKTEGGQTYYLIEDRHMLSPWELVPVDETKAKKLLKDCKPTKAEDYVILEN